jgi:hypothetical protein
MIPSRVLEKLASPDVLNAILKITEAKGYKDITIFRPAIETQDDKLHFLVTPNRDGLSLFDQVRLTSEIKKLLEFDEIILEDVTAFEAEAKRDIIGKSCPLSNNSIENIVQFCTEELAVRPQFNALVENNRLVYVQSLPASELSLDEQQHYIEQSVSSFRQNLQGALSNIHTSTLPLKSS